VYLSQDLGPKQAKFDCPKRALNCGESVEPMTGIEPAYSAWEADGIGVSPRRLG
jgi:hypothetical protein